MRYLSIIQNGQRRVAVEDIEIGGETIRAGDGIIIDLAPANWDSATYAEPEKLDLTRDVGQQLGFGYGRHQCVGQQLARAELQIVFHTLLRRIPDPRARRAVRRGAVQARSPRLRRIRTSRQPGKACTTARLEYQGCLPQPQPCIRRKASARPRTEWDTPRMRSSGCPRAPRSSRPTTTSRWPTTSSTSASPRN